MKNFIATAAYTLFNSLLIVVNTISGILGDEWENGTIHIRLPQSHSNLAMKLMAQFYTWPWPVSHIQIMDGCYLITLKDHLFILTHLADVLEKLGLTQEWGVAFNGLKATQLHELKDDPGAYRYRNLTVDLIPPSNRPQGLLQELALEPRTEYTEEQGVHEVFTSPALQHIEEAMQASDEDDLFTELELKHGFPPYTIEPEDFFTDSTGGYWNLAAWKQAKNEEHDQAMMDARMAGPEVVKADIREGAQLAGISEEELEELVPGITEPEALTSLTTVQEAIICRLQDPEHWGSPGQPLPGISTRNHLSQFSDEELQGCMDLGLIEVYHDPTTRSLLIQLTSLGTVTAQHYLLQRKLRTITRLHQECQLTGPEPLRTYWLNWVGPQGWDAWVEATESPLLQYMIDLMQAVVDAIQYDYRADFFRWASDSQVNLQPCSMDLSIQRYCQQWEQEPEPLNDRHQVPLKSFDDPAFG